LLIDTSLVASNDTHWGSSRICSFKTVPERRKRKVNRLRVERSKVERLKAERMKRGRLKVERLKVEDRR
jgi:hypothetical protein